MADAAGPSSAQDGVSEITPLLASACEPGPIEAQHQTNVPGNYPSAADKTMPVVIATWVSLASGISCICLGTACAIIQSAGPVGFDLRWAVREIIPVNVSLSALVVIFATLNLVQLRRVSETLPVLLNIIIDLAVAFFVLVFVGQDWDRIGFDCSGHYGDRLPDAALRYCLAWGWMVMPVIWVFVVSSAVVGFTALFLFTARCVLLFQRRRPWDVNWGRWRIPSGQLTVEFTVKLLQQETRQDASIVQVDRGSTQV